ncbi:thioredoxin family protein [Pseudohalocynthiibacter sp. F2068]|jgi:hypothetical protein|uniref:thioredoxin family protein n=1 Tax=Pseudohalocynthiibacter sp. F2068 TaxID=2926418 RepID=UPI001FF6D40A|nr:thioredoxin family protein [Pseudohalocynthiibacter sp. F2068]MCK0103022.1 thioredoxin family protein [Pseudohalocynthiibacter sp. F2068]
MKRQPKKPRKKRSGGQVNPALIAEKARIEGRRRFLRFIRNGAIALPVFAGVVFFSVQSVQATICEADLTKVGQGKPSIVQIHDPQCSLCQTLQRQIRKALKSFDSDDFTFLVANIKTSDGSAFAARYGVPHVTLLLFDARGEMVQIVRGPSDTDSLRTIFEAHLETYR